MVRAAAALDLAAVEEALWRAAEGVVPAAARATGALAASVMDRSRRYTSERERLDEPLADREAAADLAARALFFAVADAAKVAVPLAELDGRGLLPGDTGAPMRLCDLGAGAGAMTLGTAAYLAATRRPLDLAVTAIDRDRPALEIMAGAVGALSARLGGRVALETRADLLRDALRGSERFDLVIAGSVLNELDPETGLDLVRRALAAVTGDGAVIVIEPALRETSRALERVRDRILEEGAGHVFAPCTRRVAPCPALADPRDWCHEDRPLSLPPHAAQLASVTGLRDSGMKFSYLVLRPSPEPLVPEAAGRAALRLVSDPRKLKGRRECVGCGEGGWVQLRLLSRHRSPATRSIEHARRGDVLVVPAPVPAGRRDLTPADEPERVEPSAVPTGAEPDE